MKKVLFSHQDHLESTTAPTKTSRCFAVKLSILLLLILLLSPFRLNAGEADTISLGFPEKLDEAYQRALGGRFRPAFASFEKMIASNPAEFVTYDFYAQALELKAMFYDKAPEESKRTYERAIGVYERWKPPAGAANLADLHYVSERIEELKRKIDFTEVAARAGPWDRATVYGTRTFAIKSNLPKEYCSKVAAQLQEIIDREIEIFYRIFGYRPDEEGWIKLFIAGSWEDYKKAFRELDPYHPIEPKAFYYPEANTIIILFSGSLNAKDLAHEISHYLIHAHYIKNPSQILDQGMAEYVAYKLAKKSAKAQLLSHLQFMHWLYEQGEWERPFPDESNRFKSFEAYYLRVWALVYFFIEGGDEPLNQLFKKYLAYAKNQTKDDNQTFQKFIEKNLTGKGRRDLNNKWQSFTLSLDYEKI